ncbi:MAG: cellobiose phosphorylase [Anaerolineae bacterium]|nr:cellobiose phosphorylase [Anaerolineae bacterium]
MDVEEKKTNRYRFDPAGRFVIEDYDRAKPFASFLPGIAGTLGVPMWVFTVNRGQAIASFGVEDKDHPVMEFLPADKAYQATPAVGFRTFLKLARAGEAAFYEPFAPWNRADKTAMSIGMNDLELEAISREHGVRTGVVYFTLPGEPFAALVRQVTVTNVGVAPLGVQMLDGMPRVMPYGVDNWGLKEIGRTLEAWMGVSNLAAGVPFYRFEATPGDSAEVEHVEAGNFYLAFVVEEGQARLLPALVDPAVVFGHNTALSAPDRFVERPLAELQAARQITTGRTPCGFFGLEGRLEPGQAMTLTAIVGHTGSLERLRQHQARIIRPDYVAQKRAEAERLVRQLTDVVATQTGHPIFDAYCRQTFLDNVLRGGWPLILEGTEKRTVYHVYSRKHGDLERDYNAFHLAAEPYSQGNGNYRDVNQNRRWDVLLEPRVEDFDVLSFLELIQADGYNPLVVEGSRFVLPEARQAEVLALVEEPEALRPLLAEAFTPGGLLQAMRNRGIGLRVPPETFVLAVLEQAEQRFKATFGEGYWIDHWFYTLDLIDAYLAVYPERKDALLFERQVAFFDSPAFVRPRSKKTVLTARGVRQYGAVIEDEEKAALIAARGEMPDRVRIEHGRGAVYRTTVFAKLVGLALIKFATLDPFGMGIEMEAGKPGWYDALNGLPGLFGSSLCETYALQRLLAFLLEAAQEAEREIALPIEQVALMGAVVRALADWEEVGDVRYWDAVATAREAYRERVRLGLDGETVMLACGELLPVLEAFQARVATGIERAVEMNGGIPPTYFTYTVTHYEPLFDASGAPLHDEQGRPRVVAQDFAVDVLPLFLEGPMHALGMMPGAEEARRLYAQVRESDLFDRALGMVKVNAALTDVSHEIGRARAFTPGWLENESIWLHMAYKYLLAMLKAGLYDEFFQEFKAGLVPFQEPAVYGRSPLENSSFIVSSAHPDPTLHGAGFVARLSGSTAEFLTMWGIMMAGRQPFFVQDGVLCLAFRPALPGWLFDDLGMVRFTFLGHTDVVYHHVGRDDVAPDRVSVARMTLQFRDGDTIELPAAVVESPYAEQVRQGRVRQIDVFLR